MLVISLLIVSCHISYVICQAKLNCESKETCDACIQDIACAWCINPKNDTRKGDHCRAKEESSWCDGVPISPEIYLIIGRNKTFSNSSIDPIQVKPQSIKLRLRKGEKYNIKFQYKVTENYPLDLYFLMDMSNSMRLFKNELAKLGTELVEAMASLTTDLTLGFGTFIDKVALPFSLSFDQLKRDCKTCGPPHSFKNLLSLTKNTTKFKEAVSSAKTSGNIDNPEGGFDAIMQLSVCENIQWRKQATRLIVYCSDSNFHVAGDGKLAGVVEPNPATCYTDDKSYLIYDYPSISQLNHVVMQNKVNIIFGIATERQSHIHRSYELLKNELKNSHLGLLNGPDRRGIINFVVESYRKISQKIVFTTDAPKEIDVKLNSSCKKTSGPGGCEDVHVGDVLDYTATIEARECLPNGKQVINIFPTTINQRLTIELETVCECPCSIKNSPSYMENSGTCNNEGDLVCGVCQCFPGRLGKNCECDDSYKQFENQTNCIMEGTNVICSGLGECKCGKCQCFPRQNKEQNVYGKWCECDNYSCKKVDKLMCSGPDKGKCNCKKCECFAGYKGDACQCEDNPEKCYAPGSNIACSGHGNCVCSKCECVVDKERYSGKYCEECISCSPQRCDELKDCAACKIHKTGEYAGEMCNSKCNYTIVDVDELEDNDPNRKKCQVPDDENCIIFFEYSYNEEEVIVRVQREKQCPIPVNVLAWVAGVVGSVLIAGIIALLIWKLVTTIHDRREYAKFVNNTQNPQWCENNSNPLYREAKTTFQNPLFNRLSGTFSIRKKN